MNVLKNKKVLLLAPKFFNYYLEIKKTLEDYGADVIFFDERPSNSFLTKILIRLNIRCFIQYKIKKYYNNIICEAKNKNFDYLFLVNPETIDKNIIKKFKNVCPNITVIIYMWDSFKNKNKLVTLIPFADKFFSFDPEGPEIDKKVVFLPLFFIEKYASNSSSNVEKKYDISFVGTVHSNRYNIAKNLNKIASAQGLTTFFYFYSPSKLLFFLQKLFLKEFRSINFKDISFKQLSNNEVLDILNQSKSVLDIQHPHQKGLTMRTIEMLGNKKKLITTNKEIKKYDFYDSQNIIILDQNQKIVNLDIIQQDYKEVSQHIYNYYSISSWINNIFN